MYQSLGDTTAEQEAAWTKLYQQLRAIRVSMTTEQQRGNVAGVQALLPYFRDTLAKLKAMTVQLDRNALTDMHRFLLSVSGWVEATLQAIPDATAALPNAITQGLVKALLPVALLYLGWKYVARKVG